MSNWRDAFFGRKSAVARRGLVDAPTREAVSNEMAAAIALDQREVAHMQAIDRRIAAEERAAHDRRLAEQQRRLVEELRALVAEFGADTVTRLSRRTDPTFTLPAELLDKGETDGR